MENSPYGLHPVKRLIDSMPSDGIRISTFLGNHMTLSSLNDTNTLPLPLLLTHDGFG